MKKFLTFFVLSVCLAFHASAKDLPIMPPMATIPAGEFTMGSLAPRIGDGTHNPSEQPLHTVRIKPFKLAKYETTVGQFRQFISATGYKTQDQCWAYDKAKTVTVKDLKWDMPMAAPSEFHPVMCVTWEDANAYAQWLSKETGRHFRLPTEAEWEYAARAGSTTDHPFGSTTNALCRFANIRDQRLKTALERDFGIKTKTNVPAECDDGAEYTTVVGMYEPNAFGLYDVIGNVAEWVADCQHEGYDGAPSNGADWKSGCEKSDDYFITRGGSYASSLQVARSAARSHGGRTNASSLGEGFRLAEDIEPKCNAQPDACSDRNGEAQFLDRLAQAQKKARSAR